MNKVILSGRLTATPELKTTPQGAFVCSFTLAVDRASSKEDAADFPTIVAWQKTAEFVTRYLKKGSKILVLGELRTRTYEDNGRNRKITEIVADRIEFAESKPASATAAPNEDIPPEFSSLDVDADFVEISDDDELPF